MRKKPFAGVLLIIAALVIMTVPVSEADAEASASDFTIRGNKLISYHGKDTVVAIPDTIETIGESAFEDNLTVEKIVLSNSVKNIHAYAFWGCDNLETVVLGTGISSIEDFAFAGCKGLQRMDLTNKIASIGFHAFGDCVNLEEITIPPETVSIHPSSFDGCKKLRIRFEEGTVAANFAETFYEKQREMAEYEDISGFEENEEASDSEKNIPNEEDNNKESDTTSSNNIVSPQEGNLLSSSRIVGNKAVIFWDSSNLSVMGKEDRNDTLPVEAGTGTKLAVIDNKIIADHAFYKANFQDAIILPPGVEEIGEFSFARSNLKSITLPYGVKRVDYGAFYHCDELYGVELPETVTTVEPKAFLHTPWMDHFLAGNEAYLISGGVLVAYNGGDAEVYIPEGVRVIASEAFSGHSEIEQIYLPESLAYIGEEAFYNCSALKKIEWNEGVVRICDRAFWGCSALDEPILPASVSEIGIFPFGKMSYTCLGEAPKQIYENSATRLSNAVYRGTETSEKQVLHTSGIPFKNVRLEGAKGEYYLSFEDGDIYDIQSAWTRINQTAFPREAEAYRIALTDSSNVPIYKLGKCSLQFAVPLSDVYENYEVKAMQIDRNGQLQNVICERGLLDGEDALLMRTNFISDFFIFSTEHELYESVTKDLGVQLSSAPENGLKIHGNSITKWVKFSSGIILFGLGIFLLMTSRKVSL